MRLGPGTWPWLLRHELRLSWRALGDRSGVLAALIGALWLVLHAPAWTIAAGLSLAALESGGIAIAGLVFWFAFTLMLSGAIVLSVNALYDRGDLDLLVSAPLPVSTIFAVRGIGVALGSVALFAALCLPFVHMAIARGRFELVLAYPVLAALGLGAAGLAFALTLGLVRWLGARRARVIAQVLGAVIGALVFLLFQLQNLLPAETRERLMPTAEDLATGGRLGPDSLLWWPVRALLGDPLPALATIAVGAGLFVGVVAATRKAFLSGMQDSAGAAPRAARAARVVRFGSGLVRNVMRKERRLILRDPNLIARTLLQSLYLLPLLFILARESDLMLALAPAIIVILAVMAGNLAWITISGEEAPDLIGSAPVEREHVRWLKAASAVEPLAILALPFVAFYVMRSPLLALPFVLFLGLALGAAAVTQVWGGRPSPERDLKLRQKQNVLLNFVEFISTIAIAAACYLTMTGSWAALIVLPLGLLAPALAWGQRHADAV